MRQKSYDHTWQIPLEVQNSGVSGLTTSLGRQRLKKQIKKIYHRKNIVFDTLLQHQNIRDLLSYHKKNCLLV